MSNTLRGAIVGYGSTMELVHGPAYRQGLAGPAGDGRRPVRIVAVADSCESRRRLAAQQLPGVRVYPDHQTLLTVEASSIEFVDVATTPVHQPEVVLAAFARELHVLCQSPLAASASAAGQMVDAARRARRSIVPCDEHARTPVLEMARKALRSDEIGRVHLVTSQIFRCGHPLGTAEWHPAWRREARHAGGGVAMDAGPAAFGLVAEWLESSPTAVSARMSTAAEFDTEDDLSCTLRFPSGVASVHLSWRAGVSKVIHTIHGDRGALRLENDDVEIARAVAGSSVGSSSTKWTFERCDVSGHETEPARVIRFSEVFGELERAIASGTSVGKSAEGALHRVQLIQTAYASAKDQSRELPVVHGMVATGGTSDSSERDPQSSSRTSEGRGS